MLCCMDVDKYRFCIWRVRLWDAKYVAQYVAERRADPEMGTAPDIYQGILKTRYIQFNSNFIYIKLSIKIKSIIVKHKQLSNNRTI